MNKHTEEGKRHGKWKIHYSNVYFLGEYRDGKEIGIWRSFNNTDDTFRSKWTYDENGKHTYQISLHNNEIIYSPNLVHNDYDYIHKEEYE